MRIANQDYSAGGMNDSQDACQHLQSQHTRLVHNHKVGITPVDFLIQKIIIWNLAKGTMDSAGPQAGAVRQVAGRLACRRTHDHTKTFYRAVLR